MVPATTIITSWALLVWKALQARGLDSHTIFKKAGLDPAKLGDANARYRLQDMSRLWEISIVETGDPGFGLEVGKTWTPTTFHALGFAWLASHTLKEALMRLTRYARVVNNSLNATLEERNTYLHLFFHASADDEYVHIAGRDAGMAAVITMCRMLCGENFSPVEMNVTRQRPTYSDKLEKFVGIEINFERELNETLFDSMFAEQRLASGNSELAKVNEDVVMRYLNLVDRSSTILQVKTALIELMPSGQVSEEIVAGKLNMSIRTLQRKLHDEQTSFSAIYKSIRQEMAGAYIQDSRMSMTEISYLLGFSEQANFTRAYRGWFGTSPSEARKNIQNSSFV